ncbi:MAG: hypothetical protein ACE5EX_01820 [Phycisphaerae bacterium]
MTISILDWTDVASTGTIEYPDLDSLGQQRDDFYDMFTVDHDTAGLHDDPAIAKGWGYVQESGGTYTLKESGGIVSSRTDNGVGDITINLANFPGGATGMTADSGSYFYRVYVRPVGAADSNLGAIPKPTTLGATSFKIEIRDTAEATKESSFVFVVFGEVS